MELSDLKYFIDSSAHCHLVGIGGVSMAPLAEVLHSMGLKITGSDISDGPTVRRLQNLGITVIIGHSADNIKGANFIVRTAAVRDDNAEISAALSAGIPVFERAQAWGYIMRSYKNAVCISGTHGKTTTTSMITHILMAGDLDPTVMIGGTLPLLMASHRVGRGDTIVLEACEYYNSFHSFAPTVAVILNVDLDHIDFFDSLDDIKTSFRTFASLVPNDGCIVCNRDDKNTMDSLAPLSRELFTFGFNADARVRGENIVSSGGGSSFDIFYDNEFFAHINLRLPGMHNISNSLAAAAAAISMSIPAPAVERGLSSFTGAERRFEYKGNVNGADVYDDYAHHPSELHALLDMVSALNYKRILLAFQPHTYTRTHALFESFKNELARVDKLFVSEIYAAREENTVGISAKNLTDSIPGSVFCPTFADTIKHISSTAAPGDIILTVGAGDIYKVGEALVR